MQDSITNMFDAMRKVEAESKVTMEELNALKDKVNEPSDAFITDMQAMQKRLYTENKSLEQQNKTLTAALSEKNQELLRSRDSNDFVTATLAERDRELKDSKERGNDVQSRKDKEICRLKESITSLEENNRELSDRFREQNERDVAKLTEKDIIIQQASNDKVRLERELAEALENLKDVEGKTAKSGETPKIRPVHPFFSWGSSVNQSSVSQNSNKRQITEERDQALPNSSANGHPSGASDRNPSHRYGFKKRTIRRDLWSTPDWHPNEPEDNPFILLRPKSGSAHSPSSVSAQSLRAPI